MKKLILSLKLIHVIMLSTSLFIFSCKHADSQANSTPTQLAIEKLIVGKWKGKSLELKARDWKAYDELMQQVHSNEMVEMLFNSFTATVKVLRYNFNNDKTFFIELSSPFIPTSDNKDKKPGNYGKYMVKDDGKVVVEINTAKDLKNKREVMKIISVSEDSLIFSKEVKSSDPAFGPMLSVMHAEKDTNKIVTFIYTFLKVKDPKIVPWQNATTKGLPANKAIGIISTTGSQMFTVCGKMPYAETPDSVFASNDFGANWYSVNDGLPKDLKINNLVVKNNSLFIATQIGIYTAKADKQKWNKISHTPFDSLYGDEFLYQKKILLAVTNKGLVASLNNLVLVSIDDGLTWKAANNLLPEGINITELFAKGNLIIIGGTNSDHQTTFIIFRLTMVNHGQMF